MLLITRKYLLQSEACFLKRFFSYSAVGNTDGEDNLTLKCNDMSQLNEGNKKLLKIAILGLPNAGKSTLVNQLVRRSLCPTSSKVHTTTHTAEAIYTEGDIQLVFLDTPGLLLPSKMKIYKLKETAKTDLKNSVTEADAIGLIQDVSNIHTRYKFDNFVLSYLENRKENTNLFIILNKIDQLKKKHPLLDLARMLTTNEKYPKFDEVFMVSALTGDGVDDLRNYLCDIAKIKDWKYKEHFHTNQSLATIIEETVRAKLMDILPNEMPYKVPIKVDHFEINDDGGIMSIVTLNCPAASYVKTLLKSEAFKVKCLAYYVEKDLSHAFRTNVFVKIIVKNVKVQSNE